MRTMAWLTALVLVVAVSGCGPSPRPEEDRTDVPREQVQRIDPSKADRLEFGKTLEVVADLPQAFDGDPVLFQDFAGPGVLVGTVRSETADGDDAAPAGGLPALARSHPIAYDVKDDSFTVLDDRERPVTTQVGNVQGSETAVVWVEVVGTTIDHSAFTIYSYDRATKDVTAIAEFDDPDGQIVFGNDLDIAGDTAYFSRPTYPEKRGQEAVYAVPIDGSEPPRVIAQGGAMATISGDTLTYQVADPHDRDAYPSFFTYDLRTGEKTPVPVSAHVDDAGFCGAAFTEDWETWCVGREYRDEGSRPALLSIKETSGRTTEFAPFPIDPNNVPAPHDIMRLGRWTAIAVTTEDGQDREFLVDLDTKDVKVFPDNTSFGPLSTDRSTVLVSSYADRGPGLQRIVRIPTS